MKKIIYSLIISACVIGLGSNVLAASSGLYISPASATKNPGDSIVATVGVSAGDSKVFAVEGVLSFNGVTCKSIAVADGVTVQTSPTCANPKFLLGIPSGTTAGKSILTVTAAAGSAGDASIAVTGVDVIGEGVSLSSVSVKANYVINGKVEEVKPIVVPAPTPTITATVAPKTAAKAIKSVETLDASLDQPVASEATGTAAVEPVVENVDTGRVLGAEAQGEPVETSNGTLAWWMWLIIAIVVIIAAYIFMKKSKKKGNTQI